MAAFKVTMSSSSSSSSICGKSHLIVDKWMRSRISSSSSSSSSRSNNTRLSTKRVVRIRVLMGMNKLTTAINGEQMEVGWRRNGWRLISCAHEHFGNAHSKGLLVKNWNWRRCFSSSETNKASSISEMTSSKEEQQQQQQQQQKKKKKMGEEEKDLLLQQQDEEEQSSKLLTLPTILTLGRVAAVPLLVSTFYMTSWWATTVTTSIFIAAAITDWLDGYLARKMRLGTAFGAFLDPVADKLMVAATLVLLCTRPSEVAVFGEIPWLLPVPAIAIIGREITMSAVREWAASQDGKVLEAVAVNNLGKWKTAIQMTALTILLATRDSSLAGPGGVFAASGVALLYVSAGLAVWSLAVYMKNIWRVLLK